MQMAGRIGNVKSRTTLLEHKKGGLVVEKRAAQLWMGFRGEV